MEIVNWVKRQDWGVSGEIPRSKHVERSFY